MSSPDDEEAARCAFCAIAAGTAPATIVREWWDALAIVPLNPVTEGHLLVIPRAHVADAVERPAVTAMAMGCAAGLGASNILTSVGAAATQSVFHLHIHVVPRTFGDQLMLPWGTTGDPHEPHRCTGMDELAAALDSAQSRLSRLSGPAASTFTITTRAPDPLVRYVAVPHEPWMRER